MSRHCTMYLERQQAAELLRTARRAVRRGDLSRAGELLDWVLLLAPNSQPAERLRIDLLLREGHLDWASSMTCRQLLRTPTSVTMLLLHARCLAMQGDLRQADAALCLLRSTAPDRRDVIELAAEVATGLGEHWRAADLYARLLARSPDDQRIVASLAESLIKSGEPESARHAARLLERLGDPPLNLTVECLLAQGRYLEVLEYLEPLVDEQLLEHPGAEHDAVVAQYVTALEQCGQVDRLRALPGILDAGSMPRSGLALARVFLAQGRISSAVQRALRVTKIATGQLREEAISVAAVAAAQMQRHRLARRILNRSTQDGRNRPNRSWFDSWRRGLQGRIQRGQRGVGVIACADPSPSILRPLLRQTTTSLHARLRSSRELPEQTYSLIEHDLSVCTGALGPA